MCHGYLRQFAMSNSVCFLVGFLWLDTMATAVFAQARHPYWWEGSRGESLAWLYADANNDDASALCPSMEALL
jgi:hypothetical protein